MGAKNEKDLAPSCGTFLGCILALCGGTKPKPAFRTQTGWGSWGPGSGGLGAARERTTPLGIAALASPETMTGHRDGTGEGLGMP